MYLRNLHMRVSESAVSKKNFCRSELNTFKLSGLMQVQVHRCSFLKCSIAWRYAIICIKAGMLKWCHNVTHDWNVRQNLCLSRWLRL